MPPPSPPVTNLPRLLLADGLPDQPAPSYLAQPSQKEDRDRRDLLAWREVRCGQDKKTNERVGGGGHGMVRRKTGPFVLVIVVDRLQPGGCLPTMVLLLLLLMLSGFFFFLSLISTTLLFMCLLSFTYGLVSPSRNGSTRK